MIRVEVVSESPSSRADIETLLRRDDRFLVVDATATGDGTDDGEPDVLVIVTANSYNFV